MKQLRCSELLSKEGARSGWQLVGSVVLSDGWRMKTCWSWSSGDCAILAAAAVRAACARTSRWKFVVGMSTAERLPQSDIRQDREHGPCCRDHRAPLSRSLRINHGYSRDHSRRLKSLLSLFMGNTVLRTTPMCPGAWRYKSPTSLIGRSSHNTFRFFSIYLLIHTISKSWNLLILHCLLF